MGITAYPHPNFLPGGEGAGQAAIERFAILAVSLVLDRLIELPTRWHPVGWTGTLLAGLERLTPRNGPAQVWYGIVIALVPAVVAGLLNGAIDRFAERLPRPLRVLVGAVLLSWTFSLAGLERAARTVANDLTAGVVDDARSSLRALVSRSTDRLGSASISAAAIESLAENASDSVIAPLFWWSLGGPAAAGAYRAINTADAMVGYHGRYELLGRASARLDDLVNFVPARLTGLALCACSARRSSVRTMANDHGRTESPNAGWPMAAMAGALDRRLTKPGHYVLGEHFAEPAPADIDRAIRLVRSAVALTLPLLCVIRRRHA